MFRKIKEAIPVLEHYAQTDLRYIARGGFWLTASQIINAASAFVSSIAFAHFVPKDIFGMYQYVLTIVGLLTVVTLPKVNDAMSQAVARGLEGEFQKAFITRLRWGILASIGGLCVALYYYFQGNYLLSGAMGIVSIFVWYFDALGIYVTYLKAKRLFWQASAYKAIVRIAGLALMVLVIWQTSNLLVIVSSYFLIYSGIQFILHRITLRQFPPNVAEDPDAMRYGKSLSLLSIFKAIITQLDKVLVFHYLGATELAIYFFVVAPVDQVRAMLSSLGELAMPKFSRTDNSTLHATLLGKILRFEFIVLVPIVIFYIVLIPFIFPLVFPNYAEYVSLTQIYSVSLLFFPMLILSTALLAQKKEREIWLTRTLSPILRLIVLIPAVQIWGLLGMIVGLVVVSAIDLLLQLVAFIRSKDKPQDSA